MVTVFVGDSYTAGAHVSAADRRFTTIVAKTQGWTEVNLGRGGTGYVSGVSKNAAKSACGLAYCPSYTEMIAAVAAAKPDVVVVSGGRNEIGRVTGEWIAGVESFFTALRVALPHAQIVATSPIWDDDPVPALLPLMCAGVKWAVTAVGGVYVDLGDPLFGHRDFVADDGVHPNDAGHAAIARVFSAAYMP
jgi:GDSL-like Lipase/Acylhydrolase family